MLIVLASSVSWILASILYELHLADDLVEVDSMGEFVCECEEATQQQHP
jgi:hypothetical protein